MNNWVILLILVLVAVYLISQDRENNAVLNMFKTNIKLPADHDTYVAKNNNNVDVSMTSFAAIDGRYGNPRKDDPIRVEYSKNWDYDASGRNTVDYIHENTLWFNNQTLGDKWQFDPQASEHATDPPYDAGEYELINAGLTQREFAAHKRIPDSEMPTN